MRHRAISLSNILQEFYRWEVIKARCWTPSNPPSTPSSDLSKWIVVKNAINNFQRGRKRGRKAAARPLRSNPELTQTPPSLTNDPLQAAWLMAAQRLPQFITITLAGWRRAEHPLRRLAFSMATDRLREPVRGEIVSFYLTHMEGVSSFSKNVA